MQNATAVRGNAAQVVGAAAPCYVAGTHIAVAGGEALVETLRPGDVVRTASGRLALVRWTGTSRIDLRRHPAPHQVAPIRIAADAIANGMPQRDLLISPAHALLIDGMLMPARLLANGATIARADTTPDAPVIDYLNIELDHHDTLLAEGVPAESYLDTGNRGCFTGEPGVRSLHPTLVAEPSPAAQRVFAERGCAPLALRGAAVVAAHSRLLARAQALGHTLTDDPALEVDTDHAATSATREGHYGAELLLPAGTRVVRLRSRTFVPQALNPQCDDARQLGVAVVARLDGARLTPRTYGAGWHPAAFKDAWRWTDGEATLNLPRLRRPAVLTLEVVAAGGQYWRSATPAAERAA